MARGWLVHVQWHKWNTCSGRPTGIDSGLRPIRPGSPVMSLGIEWACTCLTAALHQLRLTSVAWHCIAGAACGRAWSTAGCDTCRRHCLACPPRGVPGSACFSNRIQLYTALMIDESSTPHTCNQPSQSADSTSAYLQLSVFSRVMCGGKLLLCTAAFTKVGALCRFSQSHWHP